MSISVDQAVARLKRTPGVVNAHPNYTIRGVIASANDPCYPQQWALHNTGQMGGEVDVDIDAPQGWGIEKDASDIIVAVIDTGIDYNHPDLIENMWTDVNGYYGVNVFEF